MKIASHEARRRTARNRLIGLATAVVALVTGVVALLTAHSGSHTRTPAPASSTASTAPSPSPTGGLGIVPTTVLPNPSRVIDGVPVGYPHTEMGAVSAAAHFLGVLDTFDPQAAQKQAQIMADPDYSEVFGVEVRNAGEQARKTAGLPPDGESDPGNNSTTQPRAFQDHQDTPDRVLVWLLSDSDITVNGVVAHSEAVSGAVMVWTQDDWKLSVVDDPPATAPQSATPGTAQAVSEGWRTLAYAT
jgi:hypothetical protein